MPYDPNAYNTYQVDSPLEALRSFFNRRQPGSRLDTLAQTGPAISGAIEGIPQAASDFLLKGPQQPGAAPPQEAQSDPRAAAVMRGDIVPMSASPYRHGPQAPPQPEPPAQNSALRGGGMSFPGGNPQLSKTPGALNNFAELSKQFNVPSISTEELYRGAYADPASRAPGAPQAFAEQLRDRTGESALEAEKMRQPSEVARINAAGGVAQQQEASRGAAGVATINQRGAQAKLEALQSMLSGGIAPGGSVSVSGVGSVRQPSAQQPNSALLNKITDMKFAAESSLGRKWSWDGATPEEQALKQSVNNFLLSYQAPDDVKDAVISALSDPTLADISNEDLINGAETDDGMPLDPQSKQMLFQLLNSFR